MTADLRKLLADACSRGWIVHRTGGGHWRLRHPAGGLVFAAGTPSCRRAVRNVAAMLRRVERIMQETIR